MIQFTIACTAGHKQTFQTSSFMIGGYAKEIAALADGSSKELSGDKVLGRCGICGAPVACTASIPLEAIASNPDCVCGHPFAKHRTVVSWDGVGAAECSLCVCRCYQDPSRPVEGQP